jgi:hypothetical protein
MEVDEETSPGIVVGRPPPVCGFLAVLGGFAGGLGFRLGVSCELSESAFRLGWVVFGWALYRAYICNRLIQMNHLQKLKTKITQIKILPKISQQC